MGVIRPVHSVRAWRPFSPIFLKKGVNSLIGEHILKMGIIRWEQNVKNKKGSFSDRRFENGGQSGRTYLSHISRECPPASVITCPVTWLCMWVGQNNSVYKLGWLRYYYTRRVQHIQRAPDLEMYRVSRLLRRGRIGSKVRTKNMINTALEIERSRRWTYLPHAIFLIW